MVQISKYKLKENVLEKLFSLFFEVVAKQKDKQQFEKILIDLFSETERIMIAKRIAVIYLRLKHIDQRTICKVLKISSSTCAKYSRLMEKSDGIVPQFNKMLREETLGNFLIEVFNEIFAPGVYGTNWSASWKRKNEQERKKREGI